VWESQGMRLNEVYNARNGSRFYPSMLVETGIKKLARKLEDQY